MIFFSLKFVRFRLSFRKYEADLEFLVQPQFQTGEAIKIWIDKANYMRQEIQGGRKFYKKYRAESMKALTFRFARVSGIPVQFFFL